MERMLVNYTDTEFKALIGDVITERLNDIGIKKDPNDKYLTREEASELIGITKVAISNRISKGLYKTKRIGKRVLISRNTIIESLSAEQIERALNKGLINKNEVQK